MPTRTLLALLVFACAAPCLAAEPAPVHPRIDNGAQFSFTPYSAQRVLFDFYFDHPQKVGTALQSVQSLMKTLTSAPYDYRPEFIDIKVLMHGTEVVTLAEKNYAAYRDVVERMRYLASIGVEFLTCKDALTEYGYRADELQDFVKIVPSAVAEIAHWQLKGYAYYQPQVLIKKFSTEEIR